MNNKALIAAKLADVQFAESELLDALQKEYPRNYTFLVDFGRYTADIQIRNHFAHRPGLMVGMNVKTGKSRRFHVSQIIEVATND